MDWNHASPLTICSNYDGRLYFETSQNKSISIVASIYLFFSNYGIRPINRGTNIQQVLYRASCGNSKALSNWRLRGGYSGERQIS